MSFSTPVGYANQGNSATATTGTITAPSSGDLVLFGINADGTGTVSIPTGGSTFLQLINQQPGSETAIIAGFWKVAGAAEPTAYTAALGSARNYGVVCHVIPSAAAAIVDAVAAFDLGTVKSTDVLCGAYDGQVIADNALGWVFGGKDTRNNASPEAYTTADNSYTDDVQGDSGANQLIGSAVRIYVTGETAVGDVRIETADLSDGKSDYVYSMHVSFIEGGGGGGGNSVSRLTLLGVN